MRRPPVPVLAVIIFGHVAGSYSFEFLDVLDTCWTRLPATQRLAAPARTLPTLIRWTYRATAAGQPVWPEVMVWWLPYVGPFAIALTTFPLWKCATGRRRRGTAGFTPIIVHPTGGGVPDPFSDGPEGRARRVG